MPMMDLGIDPLEVVMRFRDRAEAGERLASRLETLRAEHPIVIGLPRGGVPVAAAVARSLGAPLDVLVVRKLGHPRQPELGIGAIGEGGAVVLNRDLVRRLGVPREAIQQVQAREEQELARRVARYRGDGRRVPVDGRTVVLVDDGLATGFTARAAVEVLRHLGARRIVLAVPVGPVDTIEELRTVADEVICLRSPSPFRSIGEWYVDFSQVGDGEVTDLLARAAPQAPRSVEAVVTAGATRLPGTLVVPPRARGLVLFAHGSGSSRSSPRNCFVAQRLNGAGLATLLFDLLTEAEAADRRNVFDVELLGRRLVAAAGWCEDQDLHLPMGFFGASTGAAAALVAAAALGPDVAAVVSRGGRPDLAGAHLAAVTAPTLLIVGGHDDPVLELNRRAATQLTQCEHRVEVVPGATHLFEEPGTLLLAADLASQWFTTHLAARVSDDARP
jgi:putative phosphoribosyl transferase